jgi:2'-5' RNA ligase
MDPLRREFEAAWEQFQSLATLRLVPDTLESEWRRGRNTYLALLVTVGDTAGVDYLRRMVRKIDGVPGVELYPESYWHITIKGIGFGLNGEPGEGDVSEEQLTWLSHVAGEVFGGTQAFEVQLGPANAFHEVVFVEVWESLPVRKLNMALLESAPDLVRYPFDGEAFLPHVSIARFTSSEGLEELKQRLLAMRDEKPGPRLMVSEVQLVRAHLSAEAPRLETIESYRLGS